MRYRTEHINDDVQEDESGHLRATGTVTCMDANDAATGPNRVAVGRYTGPLLQVRGTTEWYPLASRADHPECWTDASTREASHP